MGVGVAHVAVVGGALGRGGEDGVGFGYADEAAGGVGVGGVVVGVVLFRKSVEGAGRRGAVRGRPMESGVGLKGFGGGKKKQDEPFDLCG